MSVRFRTWFSGTVAEQVSDPLEILRECYYLPIKPTLAGFIKFIGPRSNHSISGPPWKREAEDSICGSVEASKYFLLYLGEHSGHL